MTMCAKGVAKLIEECGELQQVLGKRLAYWRTEQHPDGSTISERMTEEMGDVLAAIYFVADKFDISPAVQARCDVKLKLFNEWEGEPSNNDDAIDGRLP